MSALVEPAALLREIESGPAPLLLDVRWTLTGSDRAAYETGHLPGAVFCDLDTDLADPPGPGGRHPLPDPERLVESLRSLGVGPGSSVVVYDGGVAAAAARAWWCLRWTGHSDVRVLDGGLPAWVAAGGPLETGDVSPVPAPSAVGEDHDGAPPPPSSMIREDDDAASPSPSSPTTEADDGGPSPAVGHLPVVADADVGRAGVLLDARSPERFRGESEPVDPVAGHIPGARSLPAGTLLGKDGRYLPVDELRGLFTEAGAAAAEPVAAYCGSGVTAAQVVLAGHEAGIEVALYPGSWSHWITDPNRPVATGPA